MTDHKLCVCMCVCEYVCICVCMYTQITYFWRYLVDQFGRKKFIQKEKQYKNDEYEENRDEN